MARLFGREYSREELLTRVGDVSQVAGVKKVRLNDGMEDGVESYMVKTGSGLNFTVLAGRAMGISAADWQGRSLAWMSSTGDVAPEYYDPVGLGFLKSFFGGLLVTCGLTSAGAPCDDEGQHLPLHGRLPGLPAKEVSYGGEWQGDDYMVWVKGSVRETSVFAENLELTRRISAKLGENKIWIDDSVQNLGFETTPLMILYHFNAGFPIVDTGSNLITASKSVTPRDEVAQPGLDRHAVVDAPTAGYREQVFYHNLQPDRDGMVTAALVNRAIPGGFGLCLRYFKDELPMLVEWKQCGLGTYVMGIEPANCHVEGRVKERERGTLQTIEPGEVRKFRIEIGVLTSEDEIAAIERSVQVLRG